MNEHGEEFKIPEKNCYYDKNESYYRNSSYGKKQF